MHVTIIGGASTIGSTVAYTLAGTDPKVDVSLVDIDQDAAWAHATDITHASYHFTNTVGASPDTNDYGEVRAPYRTNFRRLIPTSSCSTQPPPNPRTRPTEGPARLNLSATSP